ncbi:hypothetical protein TPHA_0I00750 [Tetrapisispora phaffii CBS 4417]|uniref:Uncharacterized protein n=1 Tax=Tetrapisispora phaffii (strain ATCC 24235 / CBS 4417 / NBRC 1672 / NRRL Y-8282 / UCD 70-5) TaxID=1071381 RepID=G8BXF3_TETPH|nr:hypothetical protein TPHA_0I00750 [Tetrapisispora phaffii CBS 4417]CCE64581.1 hypothetical protein TPHA_0I00750 [Tetrapisispora phaffii CBS 4417]
MTLADSIETNVIGPRDQFKEWTLKDWITVGCRIIIIFKYIVLQTILLGFRQCLIWLTEGRVYERGIRINNSIWRSIPILGSSCITLLPSLLGKLRSKLIPFLNNLIIMLQLLYQYHVVDMTFKNNNNVRIFITGQSDTLQLEENNQQMTSLLVANHRSLVDYFLINYLLQENSTNKLTKYDIFKNFRNIERLEYHKTNFICWGSISNFPFVKFFINIFYHDENVGISPIVLKENILQNGNQTFVIFPEVNIMSTELALVQRKINQEYSYTTKFYNVLYPRFKTFVNIIDVFANLKNVKRQKCTNIFENGKNKLNEKLVNIIGNVSKSHLRNNCTRNNNPQSVSTQGLNLGIDFLLKNKFISENSNDQSLNLRGVSNDEKKMKTIILNDNLYNITIVYYKLNYTEKGHDHMNGSLKLHKGYQLDQINPSLLQMLRPGRDNSSKENPPIIVIVHISKHDINTILSSKETSLEKWLENLWKEKDILIDSIENGINLN